MNCSGNCPVFDRQTSSKNDYIANFILTPDMTTNYRTEVTLNKKGKFKFNQDYWFAFKYNYVDWKKDSSAEISPFQVHPTPGSWDKRCSLRSEYSTGPLMMLVKNDETQFVTYGGKALWTAPIKKQQWQKMVVHFRPSMDDDGLVEAWIDGIKLGKVVGANSPKTDKCGNPMKPPYLKLGIYKWDWKRIKTYSARRQLLIDDIKIMTGKDGLTLMAPSGIAEEN